MSRTAAFGIGFLALVVAAVLGGFGALQIAGGDDDTETVVVEPAGAPTQAKSIQAGQAVDGQASPGGGTVTLETDDQPVSPQEASRVERAALEIAGGGTVTDLDRSDDPGETYEVEVVRGDGSEIDIALDADLAEVPNQAYDD